MVPIFVPGLIFCREGQSMAATFFAPMFKRNLMRQFPARLSTLLLSVSLSLSVVAAHAAGVTGVVKLAPDVAANAAAEDTVFVFARASQGPRMPLALVRAQVKDLPLEFSLDDSQAMMPQMKLSGFGSVEIVARVSKSGMAMPNSGDLEGVTKVSPTAVRVLRW